MTVVAVGQEIPSLTKPPLDRVQLAKYTAASGDFNPIHWDHLFATEAGMPGVIAHGMLTMGFLGELCTRFAGAGRVKKMQVRFLAVTFPGDVITCRGRVTRIEDGVTDLEIWAEKQDGSRTAAGTARLIL
jgi:acyl dehydratase